MGAPMTLAVDLTMVPEGQRVHLGAEGQGSE